MLRAYAKAELRGDRVKPGELEQILQVRKSREGGTLATTVAGPATVPGSEERQLVERWQLLFSRHAVLAGEVVRAEVTSRTTRTRRPPLWPPTPATSPPWSGRP
jgi:hypothetical protein